MFFHSYVTNYQRVSLVFSASCPSFILVRSTSLRDFLRWKAGSGDPAAQLTLVTGKGGRVLKFTRVLMRSKGVVNLGMEDMEVNSSSGHLGLMFIQSMVNHRNRPIFSTMALQTAASYPSYIMFKKDKE